MGGLITFFFFFEREPYIHSLAHYQVSFGTFVGALSFPPSQSMEAHHWDPNCKIETKAFDSCTPFQFIYMGVELWANHMG
jgi:hypothetical protein